VNADNNHNNHIEATATAQQLRHAAFATVVALCCVAAALVALPASADVIKESLQIDTPEISFRSSEDPVRERGLEPSKCSDTSLVISFNASATREWRSWWATLTSEMRAPSRRT
jgi:hypothetical protein